jgi:thermitase
MPVKPFYSTEGKYVMKNLSTGILMGLLATFATAHAAEGRYHPKQLFIKMKAGESLVSSSLIKSAKKVFGNLYFVKTSNVDELEAELADAPEIEYLQKDFYAGAQEMPKKEPLVEAGLLNKRIMYFEFNLSFNDPHVAKLWAFSSETGMNVFDAYETLGAKRAKEVIVAVVDTGVDYNHSDLRKVMWKNTKEIAGNNKDDDNNGYIDDVYGINTMVRDAQGRATGDPKFSHWHGTHVAGTIAASQNNGVGIAGVANNVKIMAIRAVPDNADELDSNIVESYLYAAKMGAKVINCSFGKTNNEGGMVVRDTINEISKQGVLVVISAGNDSQGPIRWHNNDNSPKYPASFDSENTLVIASTAVSGSLSSFSNIGRKSVDVAAPGSDIYSTVPGNKYESASGTSMAAPNVSGVVAMVMGYFPNLKNTSVKKIIMDTVTPVPAFKNQMVSGGRVNLKAALTQAKSARK